MTKEITTTENVFEAKAREMVCIPGFCGYADCMQAGMTDEEASSHTDDCNRLTFDIAKALESEREECAKIVDDECTRILSKQEGDIHDPVNTNLRMIALMLPDIATAIRSRS